MADMNVTSQDPQANLSTVVDPNNSAAQQSAQNVVPATVTSTTGKRLFVNQDICIRCQTCVMMYPEFFEVRDEDGSIHEKGDGTVPADKVDEIMGTCPSGAIQKAE